MDRSVMTMSKGRPLPARRPEGVDARLPAVRGAHLCGLRRSARYATTLTSDGVVVDQQARGGCAADTVGRCDSANPSPRSILARDDRVRAGAPTLRRHVIDRAPDAAEVVSRTLAERFVFEQRLGVERDRRDRDVDVVRDGARGLAPAERCRSASEQWFRWSPRSLSGAAAILSAMLSGATPPEIWRTNTSSLVGLNH